MAYSSKKGDFILVLPQSRLSLINADLLPALYSHKDKENTHKWNNEERNKETKKERKKKTQSTYKSKTCDGS